jgi:hypothetical protein
MIESVLGPFRKVGISARAGKYLVSSSSPPDKHWFEEFLENLLKTGIPNRQYKSISIDTYLIHACNHIITLKVTALNACVVLDMWPDVFSSSGDKAMEK